MKSLISLLMTVALALASCGKDDPAPIAVGSVELNTTSLTLAVGEEQTLTATVLPDDAEEKSVVWQSSDPTVASVSDAGRVTGLAPGTAAITATAGGKSATCSVTVEPVAVESVSLDKTELTLRRGESETLLATVLPEDAAQPSVTWQSSDTQVVTVSDDGVVAAVEPGNATVTATADGKSAICNVTVEPDVYMVGNDLKDLSVQKGLLWKNGIATELPFRDATSVYVSDGKMYIVGEYLKTINDRTIVYAGVWHDNNVKELGEFSPRSIFVSGEDIYVAGTAGGNTGYLWTKEGLSRMEMPGISCFANSVFVDGKDVYVAGIRKIRPADYTVTYWKNGVAHDLTDGRVSGGFCEEIFVAKGVVYVAGEDGDTPMLWTDGHPEVLPDGSVTCSLYVSEKGVVYVSGQSKDRKPALWINGELKRLSEQSGYVSAVFVYGEDVYAAGVIGNELVLWKNDVATPLNTQGYICSMFVY